MTYCCNNIQRAKELIVKAGGMLDWNEDFGASDAFWAGFTLGISSNIKQAGSLKEAERRMTNAYNALVNAQNAINDCSCGSSKEYWKSEENKERQKANNLVNEYNNLSSSSREKYNTLAGEWNELKDKYNNFIDKYNDLARNSVSKESAERLEAEYRKNIADYNELIGKYSGLQESRNDLSRRFDRLNENFEEMKDKNEDLREKIDEERQVRHLEELRNARTEERLRGEALAIRGELSENRLRLTDSQNQVLRLENNLGERSQEVQTLTNQMTNLRIESNERNTQLQVIRHELVRTQAERDERITAVDLQNILAEVWEKDKEIDTLREQLSQSQEGGLTERLRNREQRLESFVRRLGVNWQRVRSLWGAYEQLMRSRQNYNRDNITVAENDIERIKEEIITAGAGLENVQEICDKCEEIARLRLELEQQLEARIEVPL